MLKKVFKKIIKIWKQTAIQTPVYIWITKKFVTSTRGKNLKIFTATKMHKND